MHNEQPINNEIRENILKFRKTTDELNLIKRVSNDLRNYRKMIQLKKYD